MKNLLPGERLRAAREELGLTRPKLEALSGIKRTRLQALELGERAPSVEEAKKLSRALGNASPAFLMGLENPPTSALNPAELPAPQAPTTVLTLEGVVNHLVTTCRLNKAEATDFLTTWFDDIRKEVSEGHSARLSGFGTLGLKTNKKGVKAVTFTPAAQLKARIQKS